MHKLSYTTIFVADFFSEFTLDAPTPNYPSFSQNIFNNLYFLDFVPSTQLPEAEDLDDSIITNSHTAEKFKSAVHSFMKKSAEMVRF